MSFDALLKILPQYVDQLLKLLHDPAGFFKANPPDEEKAVIGSLVFLLLSILIAFFLRLPFMLGEGDVWKQLPVMAVFYCSTAVVLGIIAFLACRVVGGRMTMPSHVAVFGYFAGVSVLIYNLALLLARAVVASQDPENAALYEQYLGAIILGRDTGEGEAFAAIVESTMIWMVVTVLAGMLVCLGWLLVVWRIMVELNGLGRRRGLVALGLFLVGGYFAASMLGQVQQLVRLPIP